MDNRHFMYSRLVSTLFLLAIVIIAGCSKSKTPTPAPPTKSSYTAKMGGVRHWRGSHNYDASGPNFPTPIHESYNCPDTSFELTIFSDHTVKIGTTSFSYDRTDTPNQVHLFGEADFYLHNGNGKGIAYYFAKDSIVVYNGSVHATSDQWVYKDVYHTY